MRKSVIAVILAASALGAQAQQFSPTTGAITGGLIGHAIGKGDPLATLAGAIIGIQMSDGQRRPPPQTVEIRQAPMYATAPGYAGGVPVHAQTPDYRIMSCVQNRTYAGQAPEEAYSYCEQWEWNERKERNRRMREARDQANLDFQSYRN